MSITKHKAGPAAGIPKYRIGPKVRPQKSPPPPKTGINILWAPPPAHPTVSMGTAESFFFRAPISKPNLPTETEFSRDIFLALNELPHKAPDEPDPE